MSDGPPKETAFAVAKLRFADGLERKAAELELLIVELETKLDSVRLRDEVRQRLHGLYASTQVFRMDVLGDALKGGIAKLDAAKDPVRTLDAHEHASLRELVASLRPLAQQELGRDRRASQTPPAPSFGFETPAQAAALPASEPAPTVSPSSATTSAVVARQSVPPAQPIEPPLPSSQQAPSAPAAEKQPTSPGELPAAHVTTSSGTTPAPRITTSSGTTPAPIAEALVLPPEPAPPSEKFSLDDLDKISMTGGKVSDPTPAPPPPSPLRSTMRLEPKASPLRSMVPPPVVASAPAAPIAPRPSVKPTSLPPVPPPSKPASVPPPRAASKPVSVPTAPTNLGGRVVLVVDDDPSLQSYYASVLLSHGASVLEVGSSAEALSVLRSRAVDAVLCDVWMPDVDGFAFVHALRRDAALRALPVVLVSWKDDMLERVHALDVRATKTLRKEASSEDIVACFADALAPVLSLGASLRRDREVNGALDAVSPISLVRLVAKERDNTRVVVRAAWNYYELFFSNHRLIDVTRTALDGSFIRGVPALAALLGTHAGRFEVRDEPEPPRVTLHDELEVVIARAAEHLGSMVDAVSGSLLPRVAKLTFDEDLVDALVKASPPSMRRLIDRMRTTDNVRALLDEGEFAPSLMEVALVDLARSLALKDVRDAEGRDLVDLARRARRGDTRHITPTIEVAHIAPPSRPPSARPAPAPAPEVVAPASMDVTEELSSDDLDQLQTALTQVPAVPAESESMAVVTEAAPAPKLEPVAVVAEDVPPPDSEPVVPAEPGPDAPIEDQSAEAESAEAEFAETRLADSPAEEARAPSEPPPAIQQAPIVAPSVEPPVQPMPSASVVSTPPATSSGFWSKRFVAVLAACFVFGFFAYGMRGPSAPASRRPPAAQRRRPTPPAAVKAPSAPAKTIVHQPPPVLVPASPPPVVAEPAKLEIASPFSTAVRDVLVDGRSIGPNPGQTELSAGPHVVEVRHADGIGYALHVVDARAGQIVRIDR